MYKIILGIALIYAQEAKSQQIIGNPFSPDDDMMTTFQKATTAPKVDSQVVATVKKPIVIEKKKDTALAAIKIKLPARIVAKTETVVTIEEPEIEYIKPTDKKKRIVTEDDFQNTGIVIHSEGKTVAILFKSISKEEKYILYKTVIQNKALSGQKNDDDYTGSYIIPTAWWNENIANNTPRWDQIEYILLNYKVK